MIIIESLNTYRRVVLHLAFGNIPKIENEQLYGNKWRERDHHKLKEPTVRLQGRFPFAFSCYFPTIHVFQLMFQQTICVRGKTK